MTNREKQNKIVQGAILEAKYTVTKFISIYSEPFNTNQNDTKLQSKVRNNKSIVRSL
jgi:hypothetical protein